MEKFDSIVAHVHCTNDYDKFKFLSNNRDVDHVRSLIVSFKDRLVPNAILCNEKFEIIDGQNRFLALKQLGEPIYYYCIEGLNIYDVASLNSYGKNWSYIDFIKMWAGLGKEQYKKILAFKEEYPDLSLSIAINILSDSTAGQRKSVGSDTYAAKVDKDGKCNYQDRLKAGTFVIKDIEYAHYIARCIMQFKPVGRPGLNIYKQSTFASAMIQLLRCKEFDCSEAVRKATMFPTLFYRCVNAKEYIKMMEELINYKKRKKIKFNLKP